MKIAVDAFVPDTYVATSEERMVVYKRVSAVDSVEAVERLKLELTSSYGKPPREVLNLIKVALVRQLAKKLGAVEVSSFGAEVYLVFDDKAKIIEDSVLGEAIYKFRMKCAIDLMNRPMIKFKSERLCSENFEELLKFLLVAVDLQTKDATKNK